MTKELKEGTQISIKGKGHQYAGHWGQVISWEGSNNYIVGEGTFGGLYPLLSRDEFIVKHR